MKIKWLLLGNVVYVALQWLIVSFLSKRYGSVELGEYFLALSITAPVFLLLSLKLPTLAITHEPVADDRAALITARLVASGVSLIASIAISALAFPGRTNALLVFAVGLFKVYEQFDELSVAYLLKMDSLKQAALVKIQRGAIYLGCILLLGAIQENGAIAIFQATLLYSLIWLGLNFSSLNLRGADRDKVIGCFTSGFFMGASGAVASLATSFSRIYVGVVLGATALAVFGAIAYALVAFSLVVSAMGQYYLPQFVARKKDKGRFFRKMAESQAICLGFGLALLALAWIWGSDFLRIAYNQDVATQASGLSIMLVATILKASSALIGTSITATGSYSFQFRFSLLTTVLLAAVLPYMVSTHGIGGAFFAVLCVAAVEWAAYVIFGYRYYEAYFSACYPRPL